MILLTRHLTSINSCKTAVGDGYGTVTWPFGDDYDFIKFTLYAGIRTNIQVTSQVQQNPNWGQGNTVYPVLYGPDRQLLTDVTIGGFPGLDGIFCTPKTTGTYYLEIARTIGFEGGTYHVSIGLEGRYSYPPEMTLEPNDTFNTAIPIRYDPIGIPWRSHISVLEHKSLP